MDEKKLAARFAPIVRRGLAGDEKADTVRVFALEPGEPEVEIFTMPLSPKDEPDEVARFAASSALDESEHGQTDRVRLVCQADGDTLAEVVIRIKTKKASGDTIGAELLPRGERREDALIRQLMRHTEASTRLALSSIEKREAAMERREANLTNVLESLTKSNGELFKTHFDFVRQHAETVKADNDSKVALIEADARAEAVKELVSLVKGMTPRLMAKVMGDDNITPMIDIIARLTPDKVELLTASGFITEAEKAVVLSTAEKARKAIAKGPKALPGIAGNTGDKGANGKAS